MQSIAPCHTAAVVTTARCNVDSTLGGPKQAPRAYVRSLRPDTHPGNDGEAFRLCLVERNTQMQRMLFANVKAVYARLSFDNVMWVGANNVKQSKRQNYLAVFADLIARGPVSTPPKQAPRFGRHLLRD
jgi:hypothetical protein